MLLYIDATDFNTVTYATVGDIVVSKSYQINPHQSHQTMAKLQEFFKAAKIKPEEIKKIIANKGPGSFTGTRIGAAHALALGLGLNVPVKFISKNKVPKNLLLLKKQR